MAESTGKNQPKRKRANTKQSAAKGPTVPEADYVLNEQELKKIKSEVDDTVESLNENQANLTVVVGDLKKEMSSDDDDSSSQGVTKGKTIGKVTTNKGKQKNRDDLGESSSSMQEEGSTSSESGNSRVNRPRSDNDKVHTVSDTDDSSNDVTEVNGEVLPKKENVRRYPFRLSESDYLKFTQAALSRNFNATDNEEQSLQSEENAKNDEVEVKNESNDESIDFEALQQSRLERLNKLNEAVDFIKDVLAKFAEKESAMQNGEGFSSTVVKSEREEVNDEVQVIKEEAEEIKNDIEMEVQDVMAV